MEKKLRVGILGATGMVGQRFISLLENHPWFEVVTLAASPRSAGKTYEEAVGDRWKMDTPMPEAVKKIVVHNVNEVEEVAKTVDFVFSAVDMSKDEIRAIEEAYAKTETPVVSNNSAHRWTPDVPMVIPEVNPEHFAVKQYKKYKLAAGKTAKSILISCGARLAPFDIKELRELMETDEMELDTIGDRKTALFVIISDTDDTFNFVVSILYTQLFNLLCDKADDEYGGRLPVHVRCLLDEFANIGQIPKFEKLIATIRSREISASIILQSQSQLKAIYKDNADTIVGNCDTTLFLGGKEKTTLKEISEILGKETIDSFNTSETRGRELSHGLNYQKLGKQLMTEDEIAVMDGGKCILQLRGVRPFFSDKFDITKHPKYKYLSDADPKNAFDMEKHLKRRPAIVKPDEVFDYYEIDAADLQEDADHEET